MTRFNTFQELPKLPDFDKSPVFCVGIARWKRDVVSHFVRAELGTPIMVPTFAHALADARQAGGKVLVWASKSKPEFRIQCERAGVPLILTEDGFLRSQGLGVSRALPSSLVFDWQGIHYDAAHPSDLETLLATGSIEPALKKEARKLLALLIERSVTKYNVGGLGRLDLDTRGREKILVAGQVANDASVRLGTETVSSNIDLLKAARKNHPDAFIVYKPHPDVEVGRRTGWLPPHRVLHYADYFASNVSAIAAITWSDRVHVMTSLLGFEALLRGKRVTCHGLPFYAGWGLTEDKMVTPRRNRARTLEEILAVAYLIYARYLDPRTGKPLNAFEVASALAQQ